MNTNYKIELEKAEMCVRVYQSLMPMVLAPLNDKLVESEQHYRNVIKLLIDQLHEKEQKIKELENKETE